MQFARPGAQVAIYPQCMSQFGWRLIYRTALPLAVAGVVCLYLSYRAHGGSWWQSTLDAFGVGFVVGSIVDVVAISILTQRLEDLNDKRHAYDRRAETLLSTPSKPAARAKSFLWGHTESEEMNLLREAGPLLDSETRRMLERHSDTPSFLYGTEDPSR
jgi:hypothetical protein